jgi:hypothetical protein
MRGRVEEAHATKLTRAPQNGDLYAKSHPAVTATLGVVTPEEYDSPARGASARIESSRVWLAQGYCFE